MSFIAMFLAITRRLPLCGRMLWLARWTHASLGALLHQILDVLISGQEDEVPPDILRGIENALDVIEACISGAVWVRANRVAGRLVRWRHGGRPQRRRPSGFNQLFARYLHLTRRLDSIDASAERLAARWVCEGCTLPQDSTCACRLSFPVTGPVTGAAPLCAPQPEPHVKPVAARARRRARAPP